MARKISYYSLIESGQPWERPENDANINFQLYFLLTGHDHFKVAYKNLHDLRRDWQKIRREFLTEHVKRFPGTRPWAWWAWDAKEPRRILEGTSKAPKDCKLWFGIPEAYGDERYESEGHYLERVGLLGRSEKWDGGRLEPLDIGTQYAKSVVAGEILSCKPMIWSCKRHLDDLRDAHERGWYFNRRICNLRLTFNRYFRHYIGDDSGNVYEPQDWQVYRESCIFGWVDDENYRRFKVAYTEIPRKNGKTFMASIDGQYCLESDGESAPQVVCAATKRDQAKLAWEGIDKFRQSSPILSRLQDLKYWKITTRTGGTCYTLGKDSKSEDGLNPSCAIIDELHAHPTRDIWGVLETGMSARRQPLMLAITTSGFDPDNFGGQQRQYFWDILDPQHPANHDRRWAMIATIDHPDEMFDPKMWRKANLNLGVSKFEHILEDVVAEARDRGGSAKREVLVKDFNVQQRSESVFLDMDKWAECTTTNHDLTPAQWRKQKLEELKGHDCILGLDLSKRNDLTTVVAYFYNEDVPVVIPWFWLPENTIADHIRSDNVPYDDWNDLGFIDFTPGDTIDYEFVEARIAELGKDYRVFAVGFDSSLGAMLSQRLENYHGMKMLEITHTYPKMSEALRQIEGDVISCSLDHGDNPLLYWNAGNFTVDVNPHGAVKPKRRNDNKRIDGFVALTYCFTTYLKFDIANANREIDESQVFVI